MKNRLGILLTMAFVICTACEDMNDFAQGTYVGKVIDATTGIGLADVDIILDPVLAANGSVTTNGEGCFNLSRLVAGPYSINIRKTGASLIDSAEDEVIIEDGDNIYREYKLTPRVSIYDFSVDYDKNDSTKFTVNFKARGNEGNELNYFAVMWDEYPGFKFGDLANSNKKAIKKNSKEEIEISQEISGLKLKKNKKYYIRVGVTHIKNGGDYNHSNYLSIKFE